MRQLTLRLPDQAHRNLRILAAAREKTMTEVILDWIQRDSTTDLLLQALQAESGIPSRDYTKEEIDGFLKADAETPQELIEWAKKTRKAPKK